MTAHEVVRCPWGGIADPIYARYHDEEWGVPQPNDRALFEKLVLEGFQAGLSWLTILKKRENFRRAFHGFDPARIVRYGSKDIARLMADPGIVRNRLKVEATIDNARAVLKLAAAHAAVGVPVGVPRRAPADQSPQELQDRSGRDTRLQGHLQGAESGGLPLRRPDHDLRLHAVDGHGQRSHRRLPSPRALRRAAAAFQGAGGTRPRMTEKSNTRAEAATRAPRAWQRMLSGRRLDLLDPVAKGHRDRGYRPRARPGGALERADGGGARLLGRSARPAG